MTGKREKMKWVGAGWIILFCLTFNAAHAVESSTPWILLLDQSASLEPQQYAKFVQLVDRLSAEEPVAVILFGETVRIVKPFNEPLDRTLIPEHPRDRFTLLYDAILKATQILTESGYTSGGILVLSDGVDDGSVLVFDDVRETLLQKNIRLYGIGIPERKQGYRTLSRIALMSGGTVLGLDEVEASELLARVSEWNEAVASEQTAVQAGIKEEPPAIEEMTVQEKPAEVLPEPVVPPMPQTEPEPAVDAKKPLPLGWIFGGVMVFLLGVGLVLFIVVRQRSKHERRCENCGRILERFELDCMVCKASSVDSESSIPIEPVWFEKEPLDEALASTIVLEQQPTLVVRAGSMAGAVFPLPVDRPVTLGRSSHCDITLNDPAISGQHCRLIQQGTHWYLVDLKSTNGTFVNDVRIEVQEIRPGDRIRVGNHELMFRYEPVESGTGAHVTPASRQSI